MSSYSTVWDLRPQPLTEVETRMVVWGGRLWDGMAVGSWELARNLNMEELSFGGEECTRVTRMSTWCKFQGRKKRALRVFYHKEMLSPPSPNRYDHCPDVDDIPEVHFTTAISTLLSVHFKKRILGWDLEGDAFCPFESHVLCPSVSEQVRPYRWRGCIQLVRLYPVCSVNSCAIKPVLGKWIWHLSAPQL